MIKKTIKIKPSSIGTTLQERKETIIYLFFIRIYKSIQETVYDSNHHKE